MPSPISCVTKYIPNRLCLHQLFVIASMKFLRQERKFKEHDLSIPQVMDKEYLHIMNRFFLGGMEAQRNQWSGVEQQKTIKMLKFPVNFYYLHSIMIK